LTDAGEEQREGASLAEGVDEAVIIKTETAVGRSCPGSSEREGKGLSMPEKSWERKDSGKETGGRA
jgi:hypothetical protein